MAEPPSLAELRTEIDRIDAELHAVLIARGEVVAKVRAATRRAGETGSAFRPDREAALMRNVIAKDPGVWPLDAPEHLWRVILATATHAQMPYGVHADLSAGETPMREAMRFHFGFSVPLMPARSADAVIDKVAQSRGDLGMFGIEAGAGAWWRGLEPPDRPKIIARLPFVERVDHPVPLAVYVIARPQREGLARERVITAIEVERWRKGAAGEIDALESLCVASAGTGAGASLLIEHPADLPLEALREALTRAGCAPGRDAYIGCHAARVAKKAPPLHAPHSRLLDAQEATQ